MGWTVSGLFVLEASMCWDQRENGHAGRPIWDLLHGVEVLSFSPFIQSRNDPISKDSDSGLPAVWAVASFLPRSAFVSPSQWLLCHVTSTHVDTQVAMSGRWLPCHGVTVGCYIYGDYSISI